MSVAESKRTTLGDEIADYLEREGPASCDVIVRGLHRLRTNVLAALKADERFVRRGQGRLTRWHLAKSTSGDALRPRLQPVLGNGGTNGSSSTSEAGEALSGSKCSDPVLHAGFHAHYVIDDVRRCIRCDGPPVAPSLTLEEWFAGEGGEDRRQLFENDWDAVLDKTATREQIERFSYGIGATDEAIAAVAGLS